MSIFCVGFIFGPLAIWQASKAMRAMNEGAPVDALQRGQVQFGLMAGWLGLILWVLLAFGYSEFSRMVMAPRR